jgi:hypothetical protein
MVETKQNKKIKNSQEPKTENCPRLDSGCYLDGQSSLVKKQYGAIDSKSVMDQGIMLQ